MCWVPLPAELPSQDIQKGKQAQRITEDEEKGDCPKPDADRGIQTVRPAQERGWNHPIAIEKSIRSEPNACPR